MLSWSSNEAGQEIDLSALSQSGADLGVEIGVEHGAELTRFATACAEPDDAELVLARETLVAVTDVEFMIDAAAVAANFEMMTRLADATGARMPTSRLDSSADAIDVLGVAKFASRR